MMMLTNNSERVRKVRNRMRLVWLDTSSIVVATVGMIALTRLACAIGPAGPSWETPELISTGVDHRDQDGADRALAFDHHGDPAIAFSMLVGETSSNTFYARRVPGIGWAPQNVGGPSERDRGDFVSLAFDRYERPAISSLIGSGSSSNNLSFHHFDGQFWRREATATIGTWSALAFDRLGRAAIAFQHTYDGAYDREDAFLGFVHDLDGDFSFTDDVGNLDEVVEFDSAGDAAFHISLAFDPLNRPMIVHTNNNGALKFSVNETGEWFTTIVDPDRFGNPTTKSNSSLAIDPDTGYPAISYTSNSELKYAHWNGDSWSVDLVDPVINVGSTTSLAFDPTDGNPAIAYHRAEIGLASGDLRLAWHDGSTWQTDVVVGGKGIERVGMNSSIAFREFGTGDRVAAISYYDDSGNLWYIEDPPMAAVPEAASLLLFAMTGVVLMLRPRDCRVSQR